MRIRSWFKLQKLLKSQKSAKNTTNCKKYSQTWKTRQLPENMAFLFSWLSTVPIHEIKIWSWSRKCFAKRYPTLCRKWFIVVCVQGETPLHTACHSGLAKLVDVLLENGSNANVQTTAPLSDDQGAHRQTPLHLAILAGHIHVIKILLDFKGWWMIALHTHTRTHTHLSELLVPRACLAISQHRSFSVVQMEWSPTWTWSSPFSLLASKLPCSFLGILFHWWLIAILTSLAFYFLANN